MKRRNSGVKRLLADLDLPEVDRAHVEADLLDGVARYRERRASAVYFSDAELLRHPYVFGFGAVEVARDAALDLNTRLAVVRSAITRLRPLEDNGVPHGLPALLSFLAGAGALHRVAFQVVMIAADMAGDLYDDWQTDEARVLLDWLIGKSELPDADAMWWLYYLFSHCHKVPTGKAMFQFVLDHPAWPNEVKRDLCLAVLAERDTLQPPALWRAFWASLRGDEEALKQAQAELEPAVLDDLIRSGDEDYDFADAPRAPSFGFIRSLLRGGESFGLISPYFKRMAVAGLAALGEDPLAVCRRYLGRHDYYTDGINLGVADVIRALRSSLPDAAIRDLIETALSIGSVVTRREFYALGAELFGADYLERAQRDNAGSIRQWALRAAAPGTEDPSRVRRARRRRA